MADIPKIEIWTDGGCKPNPGRAGWGAVFREGKQITERSGFIPLATNQQAEMIAVASALECVVVPSDITLYTDSRYLYLGITDWIHNWQKRGWISFEQKPVANRDLWERILAAAKPHAVKWVWVKGHANNQLNNKADQLATKARLQSD